MKTRLYSFSILIIALVSFFYSLTIPTYTTAQSDTIWSSPQVISSGSSTESWRPTINVDSENNVHVIWEQRSVSSGPREIYHRLWNDTTRVWSTTTRVSLDNNADSRGPHSSMDELGNLYVVWYDSENSDGQGDRDIYFRLWEKSTKIWSSVEPISTESNQDSYWPAVAGRSGIAHVVWQDSDNMLSDGSDVDIFYKNRSVTGVWSPLELVSTVSTGTTETSRFPSIAVDSFNNVHVTWDDLFNYNASGTDLDVFYRMKNHSTASWETTVVVSEESSGYSERSKVKIDNSGNIHIVWGDGSNFDSSGTDSDIFYKMYNKTLDSWLRTEVTNPESPWNDYVPSLSIDSNEVLHLTWFNGSTAGSTNKDVVYKTRSQSGEWSASVPIKSGTGAWRPEIATGIDNRVHIVFQDGDNSYDGTDDDIIYVYGTPSTITNLTIIDAPDDFTYRIGKTGNIISWILADPTTLTGIYSIKRDGVEQVNNTWVSYEKITHDVDGLEIGTYNYTLIASDGSGEEIKDTVFVTVREPGFSTSELQTLLEVGIGLVIAICVVGLTVFIILRRRKHK